MKIQNSKLEIPCWSFTAENAKNPDSSRPRDCRSLVNSLRSLRSLRLNLLISSFFRNSEFGFRACSLLVICFIFVRASAVETNSLPDSPSSLRPPRGEILPTFWEQYGAWVIVATAVLVVGVAFLVWLLTRPKPAIPVPWSVQARQELEPLRNKPEDGMLLSRVSQIVRHHIASAFALCSGETTTSEFCRELISCEKIGPELTAVLSDFLKECDRRKFAPSPPQSAFGAVARALEIIEGAENRLKQPVPAPLTVSDLPGSPKENREAGAAAGG